MLDKKSVSAAAKSHYIEESHYFEGHYFEVLLYHAWHITVIQALLGCSNQMERIQSDSFICEQFESYFLKNLLNELV